MKAKLFLRGFKPPNFPLQAIPKTVVLLSVYNEETKLNDLGPDNTNTIVEAVGPDKVYITNAYPMSYYAGLTGDSYRIGFGSRNICGTYPIDSTYYTTYTFDSITSNFLSGSRVAYVDQSSNYTTKDGIIVKFTVTETNKIHLMNPSIIDFH